MMRDTSVVNLLAAIEASGDGIPDLSAIERGAVHAVPPRAVPCDLERALRLGLVTRDLSPGHREAPHGVLALTRAGHQMLEREGAVSHPVLGVFPRSIDDLDAREAFFYAIGELMEEFQVLMERDQGPAFVEYLLPERWRHVMISRPLALRFFAATAATCARAAESQWPDHLAGDVLFMRLMGRALRTLTLGAVHGVRSESEAARSKAALAPAIGALGSPEIARLLIEEDLEGMASAGFRAQIEDAQPGDIYPPSCDEGWFTPYALAAPITPLAPELHDPHGLVAQVEHLRAEDEIL